MSWIAWLISLFRRPTPPPPAPAPTGLGAALLAATNAARAKAGRPPLLADSRLQTAASSHAASMAGSGVLSHAGFPGRLTAAGYVYAVAAENVAGGQADPRAAVDAWMADEAHRANMLGAYTQFGGAGARSRDGSWFWCADYGVPA
jgi:uncharacterized protein YkwD